MTIFKQRFQDPIMQRQYEEQIKTGVHWRTAERKVIEVFKDYDEGLK